MQQQQHGTACDQTVAVKADVCFEHGATVRAMLVRTHTREVLHVQRYQHVVFIG
jgi:hypothetical protein